MSALDKITDIVTEIEFAEDTAEKLLTEMAAYETKYHGSFANLMRKPGFRKLWDAIEEAAIHSMGAHGDLSQLPPSIAKRHGLTELLAEFDD